MPKLVIKDRSGNVSKIDFDSNFTLMEALRDKGYDIEASCGGCCACATCHVYINDQWLEKISPKDDDEESLTISIDNNRAIFKSEGLFQEVKGGLL